MKKAYQSPEIHRVELTPMPEIDLANASDEELSAAMKAGLYFENKVCYQQNREFKICELLGRTVLMPVKRDAEQIIYMRNSIVYCLDDGLKNASLAATVVISRRLYTVSAIVLGTGQ